MDILNNAFYAFWYAFGDCYPLLWALLIVVSIFAMLIYFLMKR